MPGIERGGDPGGWGEIDGSSGEGVVLDPQVPIDRNPNSPEAWGEELETGPTFERTPEPTPGRRGDGVNSIDDHPEDEYELTETSDAGVLTHVDLAEHRSHEEIWGEADAPTVSQEGRHFQHPSSWVHDINGAGTQEAGRTANCVDAARAVEARWRGQDATAAPLADPNRYGTDINLVTDWSGGSWEPASYAEVEQRLRQGGHGSSAIVAAERWSPPGHAINAVNHQGDILWIDGQRDDDESRYGPWPPPDYGNVKASRAVFYP